MSVDTPQPGRPFVLRHLATAYAALALLALAAARLASMDAVALGVAVVALAILPMAALWHRSAIRRLERLHRFAPDRWLWRWGARRALGQVAGALVAIGLAAAVLLQSPYFGALEWGLLAAAPLVLLGWSRVALRRAGPLFSRRVYAASAAAGIARLLAFTTLCAVWVGGRYALASTAPGPLAETVYELQSAWPATGSAAVRWAIDAGAWNQAIVGTLDAAAQVPWWHALIAVVFLPLTAFGYAVWSASGATLGIAEWRRMLGTSLTDADVPPPIARLRLQRYAACAAAAGALTLLVFSWGDGALVRQPRMLALAAVPQCERIGARMYSLGTLAKVAAYTRVLERDMQSRRTLACARITEIGRVAAANVDAYLDWYWSLGADWTRLALMLSGDAEALVEFKFNKLVASDPRIASLLGELQIDQQYLADVASLGRGGIAELLERQRFVLDERQCRVVTDAGRSFDALLRYDALRTRAAASVATGVVSGAFAGALTARAMRRASMQAAGRALGRLAVKRGASRLGSAAAAGALAGSVVPGVGTAVGLAAGIATDAAGLAIEEKLERADMRRDLLASIDESLATLRAAFDCPAR